MELWTAFALGLIGSLHCAGMCGPLVLALPGGGTRSDFIMSRTLYNAGRLTTYGVLGILFGLLGRSLAIAGLQRWASIGAGVAILVGLLASNRTGRNALTNLSNARHRNTWLPPAFGRSISVYWWVSWLKSRMAKLFKQRAPVSLIAFGALNGLLPCGLVYVACAAAVSRGDLLSGAGYMLAFGLGTTPVMLGLGLIGTKLRFALGSKFQKLIPAASVALAVLLVFRGLGLGIPYLSPSLTGCAAHCSAKQHPLDGEGAMPDR